MLSNLLAWAAQAALLVAVACLVPVVLRVRSPRPQLVVFQVVLPALLLLPLIQPWRHPVAATPMLTAVAPMPAVSPVERVGEAPFDWERAVLYVLGAGIVARGTWLVLGLVRLRRYRRYAEPIVLDTVDVPFAMSTDVTGPVTFGWRRPIVLVPPMFLEMPAEQREAVVTHEWLHVQRRDWLFCIAEESAAALMWFHPAVWLLIARIRTLREQVVDAESLAITKNRQQYVEALLTMAEVRPMLDVAAAPLFLRKRDLTNRVKNILEARSMSVRRIVCSYTCVVAAMVAVTGYSVSTFPLVGAPMQSGLEVRGTLSRIDVSRLPQPLQTQVESRVAPHRNAPFTTDLMLRIKADIAAMDSRIEQNWLEERPQVYSVSFAYRTDEKFAEARVVRIDTSRIPEPLRSQVEARLSPFVNAPFRDDLMHRLKSTVTPIDRKISYKWSNEPGGNVSLSLLYDAPDGSWQPIGGVLARIELSALPEPDRTLIQQRLGKYVNAPFTNALMQEISTATMEVSRNWAMMWRVESPGVHSLTIGPPPPGMGPQSAAASQPPDFPSDGEKQIRVGDGAHANTLKVAPTPVYPPLAMQARIQGVVRFNVQIDKSGRVKRTQLISGHPLLVESAKEVLARYEYETTLLNGEPVQVVTVADVNFRLSQ